MALKSLSFTEDFFEELPEDELPEDELPDLEYKEALMEFDGLTVFELKKILRSDANLTGEPLSSTQRKAAEYLYNLRKVEKRGTLSTHDMDHQRVRLAHTLGQMTNYEQVYPGGM